MDWNRESVAATIVAVGGAYMLGTALLAPGAQKLNGVQRRGLALSGAGFLVNVIAVRWLQGYGRIGVLCSLAGTALAMIGMYQLVKERAALEAARRAASAKHESPK